MTLEQFKENAKSGVVADEKSIEAIMNAFGNLPLSELYHKNMRSNRFDETDIISEILSVLQIPEKYMDNYDYTELAQTLLCAIRYDNLPDRHDIYPEYTNTALALDDLSLLACRFIPSYRKRKGA